METNITPIICLVLALLSPFIIVGIVMLIECGKKPTNDWRIYKDGSVFFMKRRYTYFHFFSKWNTIIRFYPPMNYSGTRHFKSIKECEEWAKNNIHPSIEFVKEISINKRNI